MGVIRGNVSNKEEKRGWWEARRGHESGPIRGMDLMPCSCSSRNGRNLSTPAKNDTLNQLTHHSARSQESPNTGLTGISLTMVPSKVMAHSWVGLGAAVTVAVVAGGPSGRTNAARTKSSQSARGLMSINQGSNAHPP